MTSIMNHTDATEAVQIPAPDDTINRINLRIGNTTFLLGLHYSTTSKLTLEDKIKKLIRRDMESGNF